MKLAVLVFCWQFNNRLFHGSAALVASPLWNKSGELYELVPLPLCHKGEWRSSGSPRNPSAQLHPTLSQQAIHTWTQICTVCVQKYARDHRFTQCQNPSVLSTHAHQQLKSESDSRCLWTWIESPTWSTETNCSNPTNCCISHPFVFMLTASSSDKCEKETGVRVCVCLCSSLSTCVNNIWRAPTVEKRDVHSLFNNNCRLLPG